MDTAQPGSSTDSDGLDQADCSADQEMVDSNGLVEVHDEASDGSSSSSDDDGSESDDDDDDGEEMYAQLEEEAGQVRQQLESNPYYYEGHVRLICLLKKMKDTEGLRRAREAMSTLFPLTEELWLDWLADESDREEKQKLLEKAVEDYDSPQVWSEFIYRSLTEGDDQGQIREVFERAIGRLGLHPTAGSFVWDAYRKYEGRLAGDEVQPTTTEPAQGTSRSVNQQTGRLARLFARQLSCPLLDLERTYREYVDWAGEIDPLVVKKYEESVLKVKDILPFEEKLTESNSMENYVAYLDHLIEGAEPNRIVCLFERAIKDHPVQSDLWVKYTRYLEKNLKVKDVILKTYSRSVRNCPWCLELWLGSLLAMEGFGSDHELIRGTFNEALSVGFSEAHQYLSLWTAYVDYLRRRIDWKSPDHTLELETLREAFANATNQLYQTFSNDGDPTCSLLQYQAFIEAKFCKDMTRARELYTTVMQRGPANRAAPWLQYVQLERSFGDAKHCRKVFQRALNSVTDWPEYIADEYLRFEREEGDLERYIEARDKCAAQLKRVEVRRAKEAEKEPKEQKSNRKPGQKKAQAKNVDKGNRPGDNDPRGKFDRQRAGGGRKAHGEKEAAKRVKMEGEVEIKPYVKTRVFVRSDKQENQPVVDSDGFKVPALPSTVGVSGQPTPLLAGPPPGYKRKRDEEADSGEREEMKKFKESPDVGSSISSSSSPSSSSATTAAATTSMATNHNRSSNELSTVFVSNLDYTVPKETVEGLFGRVGKVKEVRMVMNRSGQSKGFCYVEFEEELSALEALKMDRRMVDGRPMFVSKCKTGDRSKESKLKFEVGLEKCKLFIKNLSLETTKESLQDLFKEAGHVKDVRIVTFRNGRPKGIAYIEYDNEENARQAILKFNDFELDGHRISVDVSNPPARGQRAGNAPAPAPDFQPSLGGGKKKNPDGARIQLPMIPRSVARK